MDPNQPPQNDSPGQSIEQIRARRLLKLGSAAQRPPSDGAPSASAPAPQPLKQNQETAPNTSTTASPPVSAKMPSPLSKSGEPSGKAEALGDKAVGTSGMTLDADTAFLVSSSSSSSQSSPARPSTSTTSTSFFSFASFSSASSSSSSSPKCPRKRLCSHIHDCLVAMRPSQLRKLNPQPEKPIEDWTSDMISHVFGVTLDPNQTTGSHRLTMLDELAEELSKTGAPLRFSLAHVDQVIFEATAKFSDSQMAINYLYPCWKRAMHAAEHVKTPAKKALLDELRRLSHSNALFACIMPEMFSREDPDAMASLLLGEVDREDDDGRNERNLFEFFREAVPKFAEDPDVYSNAFVGAMENLSARLAGMSLMDNYKPFMNALHLFTRFPPLIAFLVESEKFVFNAPAHAIEKDTIFGPFFQLSPLQPDCMLRDFHMPQAMDASAIKISQESVRVQCSTHQKELLAIVKAFVRHSVRSRNRVLDWFAHILNTNQKRRALRLDPKIVSSDGFMVNVTAVLDHLAEPFLDNSFEKIDRISPAYFSRSPRLNIDDETKLNADLADSKAYWDVPVPGENNFMTDVFFLTLAAHYYGTEAMSSHFKDLDREIKWLEQQVKALEARKAALDQPLQIRYAEQMLKRHTQLLEAAMANKYASQGILLDPGMQGLSLRFMRFVAVWLLRVATQTDYRPTPHEGETTNLIELPLKEPAPKEFTCLPEYVIMSVVENFKFIFRFMPNILVQAVGEELVALCIAFLHASNHIKNPYLKSSLVTILYWGTLDFSNRKSVLAPQLIGMKFANDHLLHALMKFYIECESTGAHTQFYDKFNIRFEIFQVIKVVWVNDVYKRHLARESEQNKDFFVRFVNMLLNDATFVLDEALTKFPKIHDLEGQIEGLSDDTSQEDRAKLEEELQTLQGQATSYMQLANESLEMMKLFTRALAPAFTMPEIAGRLASMMNYNLETLVGPKANQLKVTNMERYKFRPIMLVSDFVAIYLNLGVYAAEPRLFVDAVAADGRCFKPENFARAGQLLGQRNMVDPADLARWTELQSRFQQAKDALDQAELDLGDIPPEFEDPIMGDLMTDPVRLPSRHIVDRQTIVQHLLSDAKDPFTRQPMTIEDVVPEDGLREKIERWRGERIAAARGQAMDLS